MTRSQGGTLIFSYIRRLGSFLGGSNFEVPFFWGFKKNENFWGLKVLWIFFWVITKLDYMKGSFLYILGSFLKAMVQNGGGGGGIFRVAKISNVFWGA